MVIASTERVNGAFSYRRKKRELRKLLSQLKEPTGLTAGDIMRLAEEKRKSADHSINTKTVFVYSKTVKVKLLSKRKISPSSEVEIEINEK